MSFCEQCGADVICVEDEHPPLSTPLCNDLAFFLDEAPKVGEPDLHSLVDDLTNRHQVFRYCRDFSAFMSFPFCSTWLRELLQYVQSDAKCHLWFRPLPVAPVAPNMRTTLHGSSCDLMIWSQRTTPRLIVRWTSSLNLPYVSSGRLALSSFGSF